jgi:hypothetical protein
MSLVSESKKLWNIINKASLKPDLDRCGWERKFTQCWVGMRLTPGREVSSCAVEMNSCEKLMYVIDAT